MTQSELIVLNFKEIRRRNIKLWEGLPKEYYHWKPDNKAMSASEMIRHVLEADYGWNFIINKKDVSNLNSPWKNKPFLNLKEELEFAKPFREAFLKTVLKFSNSDLKKTEIIHPGNGDKKNLAKYLYRIGYHESVHTGQFLAYLRTMNVDRPLIWD